MKKLSLLVVGVIISCFVFAQNDYVETEVFKTQFQLASDHIFDGNFHKAIAILDSLNKAHPDNFNIQFQLGFCLLNTALRKKESIK